MSDLTIYNANDTRAIVLPEPRISVSVREATHGDLPFIDGLHKQHTKMVGWFPTAWFEKNVADGCVLIAEQRIHRGDRGERGEETLGGAQSTHSSHPSAPSACSAVNTPVGYCIARDKYMKREECGIVYQLNVTPGEHRKLVGATLIKHVFDRAAYGCTLFCCWCAQDLEANYFWESIGFVPLAFRTGSRRGKTSAGGGPRIHIFWQRRIREGDTETPYWFPSETTGGAVRENRLVLPIPPGTHWRDAKPAVLPGWLPGGLPGMERIGQKALEADDAKPAKRKRSRRKKEPKVTPPPAAASGGLWFAGSKSADLPEGPPEAPAPPPPSAEELAKEKEAKRQARRNDPKLVAAARELRDRYTEQINAAPGMLPPSGFGKYDVSRALAAAPSVMNIEGDDGQTPMLDAA